jgi:hypothetical protein
MNWLDDLQRRALSLRRRSRNAQLALTTVPRIHAAPSTSGLALTAGYRHRFIAAQSPERTAACIPLRSPEFGLHHQPYSSLSRRRLQAARVAARRSDPCSQALAVQSRGVAPTVYRPSW